MPNSPRISIVVISRNEGKYLARTVENLEDTLPDGYEIVIVDDGSTDGSTASLARRRGRVRLHRSAGLGVARSRVFGASKTRGDFIVFADAHIGLDRGWWQPLLEPLHDPKVGATAPVITNLPASSMRGYGLAFRNPAMEVRWRRRHSSRPVEAPILPGCCVAVRRDLMEATGGAWDPGLLHRGNVDNEFSVRLWLLGYKLLVVPEVLCRHRFRERSPFPVGWPQYLHNRLRLAFVHFNPQRLGLVVAALRNYPSFGEALNLLLDGDASARRRELAARRVRDDDWFSERFGMNW